MGIGEETTKPIWGSVSHTSSSYALNGKIMLSSAIILFLAISMILCFHCYARWSFRRQERRIRRRIRAHLRCLSASPQDQPLDTAVLEKIPIFVYSSTKTPLEKEECAICLSDFEEDDEGRLLPKCGHAFHIDCIDTWFRSRSTCPLCRAPVQSEITSVKPVNDIETGSSSSSSSSSSSTSLPFPMEACEREPIDLVGIIVDTPRELEDSNPGLPNQTESKPTIWVLFFKKLWSFR